MTPSISRTTWIAVGAAGGAIVAVAVVVAAVWTSLDAAEMSGAGWGAMILGIVVTLALGVGLMTLVFISNRRGYDEPDRPPPS